MRANHPITASASVGFGLATLLAVTALAQTARADVRHEGDWPADEKTVSLDVAQVPRSDAVKKLADAAGWSVVMSAPINSNEMIDLHVKNQPASKVLDLLLANGSYVAKRDGTLVSIAARVAGDPQQAADDAKLKADDAKKAAAGAMSAGAAAMSAAPLAPLPPVPVTPAIPPLPPVAPLDPLPPVPSVSIHGHHHDHGKHGAKDRTVTGGHVTIAKDETVGDLTVLGGSVDVEGEIEGDLLVLGGEAEVHEGAAIHGDAATIGGSLNIDDGASVDGDVSVLGGALNRAEKAHIGGSARDGRGEISVSVDTGDEGGSKHGHDESEGSSFGGWLAGTLAEASFLFVFGAVLLALFTSKMDGLKTEVAARPMRSFALGVLGAIATCVTFVVLCVTIIGIPIALLGLILVPIAVIGAMTAVLTTAGQAVLGHKTRNPYVHLAAGAGMLLVLGAIPVVGVLAWIAVILVAIGTLVATRGAGMVPRRPRNTPTDPYRSPASL